MAASKADFSNKRTLTKITKMISEGYTESSIAKSFGYSPTHFSGLKKIHPELSEAIKDGRIDVEHMVRSKLFMMMMDDSHPKQFSALCFYAKCKLGWSQEQNEINQGQPKRPTYKGIN